MRVRRLCCLRNLGIMPLNSRKWLRNENDAPFPWQHAATATAKSLQSCLTLCDPIPGILQAGTLEWVAISFSNA